MPDLGCWGGSIVPETAEYRPKSVMLECKCGMRGWHTKNIGYIGARTIFNFACGCEWMQEQTRDVEQNECHCPGSYLRVSKELMDHIRGCPECQKYGL